MKHLSSWLESQGQSVGDLTPEVAVQFMAARRLVHSYLRGPRALVPLLDFLRDQGAAPMPTVVAVALAEVVAERFAQYLSQQRGLATATVCSYVSQVRPFLAEHVGEDGRCGSLTARQVAAFVTGRAVGQRPRSVQVGANALRALLRWRWMQPAHQAGLRTAAAPRFPPYFCGQQPHRRPPGGHRRRRPRGRPGDTISGMSTRSTPTGI